jgi:succinate-semialdehyde dehydrogenase/glutarate-semialdehyde dehydrogenase
MHSINPANGQILHHYQEHTLQEVDEIVYQSRKALDFWSETLMSDKTSLMKTVAGILRSRKNEYSRLITMEMGKIIRESEAEIEKCAVTCEYYAEHAPEMLRDEIVETDASKSLVTFQPLGTILAVMPWNFPFWQVFRFAAPSLLAGNGILLKHASNVQGCAMAIESAFREAGFPVDLFRTLVIPSSHVEYVISHPLVNAITLTGSEDAGSKCASTAAKYIKKSVLELGGSDPFIVLADADLQAAVKAAVSSRMINQGQSCIAAKRFIVMRDIAVQFEKLIKGAFSSLLFGDPLNPATQVGPLARPDLVEEIHRQVTDSIAAGARLVYGGEKPDIPGCYYSPTILADVQPGMPVYHEETFGPVATIITVDTEDEAITVANATEFGLGAALWTADIDRGERMARQIEAGAVFINGITKSDPRLPFGGVKRSGFGRELSSYGMKEFVNIKTIWIG